MTCYAVWMYSKVKRLRVRGARRSDRDIQSDPGEVGHLSSLTAGGVRELKLHPPGDDSQRKPMLPILYDPVFKSMSGNRMLFAGLERQGDQADSAAPLCLQEWAIEVTAAPPI
jgi:hypothetical protein